MKPIRKTMPDGTPHIRRLEEIMEQFEPQVIHGVGNCPYATCLCRAQRVRQAFEQPAQIRLEVRGNNGRTMSLEANVAIQQKTDVLNIITGGAYLALNLKQHLSLSERDAEYEVVIHQWRGLVILARDCIHCGMIRPFTPVEETYLCFGNLHEHIGSFAESGRIRVG